MRYRVTCTTKDDKFERITSLGSYGPGNVFLTFSEAEVIQRLESTSDSFYVERPTGHVVDLIVAEREGRKYVKTEADGEKPDNLLCLPTCPEKKHHSVGPVRTLVGAASHGSGWGR